MSFVENIWNIIQEFSPYLILGCFISGLLSIYLTVEIVQKYLGKKSITSVFLASLLGVPLPLCSCGVIPVSAYLSKHGASKGSVTSFLISTPQTGIDSIFITYGMLGPVFAIYRPIVAFISGIFGGSIVHAFDNDDISAQVDDCSDDCCDENHSKSKIYKILHYGFIRLPLDIVNPLIIGIILSALIIVLIPSNYFDYVGSGMLGMIIMLFLGLPTYVCATASVPIAFALYTKGFSLGAMLVFLMTGPATNITTMTVIYKVLGRKNLFIYLLSIIVCSISAGLFFDLFVYHEQLVLSDYTASHLLSYEMKVICSIFFTGVLINALRIKYFSRSIESPASSNKIIIEGMTCSHCGDSVLNSLKKIKGISNVSVDFESGLVQYSSNQDISSKVKEVILSLGYKVNQ